jgi:hypothetical protein
MVIDINYNISTIFFYLVVWEKVMVLEKTQGFKESSGQGF